MGWKAIKTHYKIDHIVQVSPKGILIGSPYLPELLTIAHDGTITASELLGPDALKRVYAEMLADLPKLRELLNTPDTFETSLEVYTYEDGEVLVKHCEALGWPNVTHDGLLMYENMFSTDKQVMAQTAKRNAMATVRLYRRRRARLLKDLEELNGHIDRARSNLQTLKHAYPKPKVQRSRS